MIGQGTQHSLCFACYEKSGDEIHAQREHASSDRETVEQGARDVDAGVIAEFVPDPIRGLTGPRGINDSEHWIIEYERCLNTERMAILAGTYRR